MRVGSSFSRLKWNTPAVNGNSPGRFLAQAPAQQLAVVLVLRQRHLGNVCPGKRSAGESGALSVKLFLVDLHHLPVAE
jgi:hypothetical protein